MEYNVEFIEDFKEKKIYHHLLETKKDNKILFILPDMSSLKNFDVILKFLKSKFTNIFLKSGLFESIKNRDNLDKKYEFISLLNREILKEYVKVIRLPDIYDYSYFISEILGFSYIPELKITEAFNFVVDYYKLKKFIIVNLDKDVDKISCAEYLDFLESKELSVILIGDSITCAEIVNNTKTNPIVIYNNNRPLISDLIKRCRCVVSNKPIKHFNIKFNLINLEEEIKIFESLK